MSHEMDEARAIRWALGRGPDAPGLLRRLRGGLLESVAYQVGAAIEDNARLTDADLAEELVGRQDSLTKRGLWQVLVGEIGQSHEVGEAAYARAISANVESLKEEATRRELPGIARGLEEGTIRPADAWAKLGELRARIETLATGPDPKKDTEATDIRAALDRFLNAPKGLLTGWNSLQDGDHDKAKPLIQLAPEELSVVGARTSHGKTSFMVGAFANLLRDHEDEEQNLKGRPIFYSAEESVGAIAQRLVDIYAAAEDGSGLQDQYAGRDGRSPQEVIAERVKKAGAMIVDADGWTIDEIVSHAELAHRRVGVSVVFVDYLQRIPAGREYERRDVAMGEMGRKLKKLAKGIQAPVIVGAQANRQAADGDGEMQLHHLREGGIEQEADLVLGLYLEGMDTNSNSSAPSPERELRVRILKNRNRGGVGERRQLGMRGRVVIDG